MGYMRETSLPAQEPVALDQIRRFLRLPPGVSSFDADLQGYIVGARQEGERITGRALAQRTFAIVLDAHPYYTDTIQSQLAYPPSYYSLPKWSTTLWNYSQMIKLAPPPVVSVQQMRSINPDGSVRVMNQDTDFILDRMSEPARVFPLPGQYWPPDLYVANALEIDFTAGYDPDPTAVDVHSPAVSTDAPGQQPVSTIMIGVPQKIVELIRALAAHWFRNPAEAGQVPDKIALGFEGCSIRDWALTRG